MKTVDYKFKLNLKVVVTVLEIQNQHLQRQQHSRQFSTSCPSPTRTFETSDTLLSSNHSTDTMQYMFTVSLLLSLTAMTIAGPVQKTPPTNFNVSKRGLGPAISKRGVCSPTGDGVCNLGITSSTSVSTTTGEPSDATYHLVQIFDKDCNEVGRAENPVVGSCLYSQLPWTVCLDDLSDTIVFPSVSFRYGAGSFSNCACADESFDGNPYSTCQCAFTCT